MKGVLSDRYQVNQSKVIFEAFENEMVLINLDSGNYYSFSGSGAFIWDLLAAGSCVTEVVQRLREHFSSDGAEIESSVTAFVQNVVSEGLVLPRNGESAGNEGAKTEAASALKGDRFEPPQLQKFSDMQELLLLDPIHEVDEMGWPHTPPPGQ
jgi:hypothetical protein